MIYRGMTGMAEMDEKRRFRRRRVLKEGWLILEPGLMPLKCVIRDESEGGAKLRVPARVALPKSFSVVFVTEGTMYPAEIVWRHCDDVGIAFVGKSQPAPTNVFGSKVSDQGDFLLGCSSSRTVGQAERWWFKVLALGVRRSSQY